MESRIAKAIRLQNSPVAVSFAEEKPAGAIGIKEGVEFACVLPFIKAASKGKTAAFEEKNTPCPGGKAGLCFGDFYDDFPGGFNEFLSTRPGAPPPEVLATMDARQQMFVQGEGYKKTPELVAAWRKEVEFGRFTKKVVVFEPLGKLEGREAELVCFFANADQVSALTALAGYRRQGNLNVLAPFGAGCQQIVHFPYREAQTETPRAILGCTDLSVRRYLDPGVLSFTVPWSMFLEMEEDVEGSFLTRHTWTSVAERIGKD